MTDNLKKFLLLLLVCLVMFKLVSAASAMPVIKIVIHRHTFTMETPQTTAQFEQGLMHRHFLAPSTGMFFLFNHKNKKPILMWMKNTYIPLDMIFIDNDGYIRCVIPHTIPLSLNKLSCDAPNITAVIEINAGEAERYHIQSGDKVKVIAK